MDKLKLKNINYSYEDGGKVNKVINDVNAEFKSGKLYAIVGESGSGKTSLISLISALESLQEGDILFNDTSINDISLEKFRLSYVNIVFQSYNLINYMTAKENVEVALDFSNNTTTNAIDILDSVGIDEDKANRLVLKLSGGEQQRVAIARSFASDVPIIVADEPTGNLDEETEDKIMELFKNFAKKGKIVILVTHSKKVASKADVVYKMKKGKLETTTK
ncbi:MAG: ABC transporter ATP-binding protein [bacterium]